MTGQRTRRSGAKPTLTSPGVIRVTPRANGWYLVEIGRTASTKRFNLTRTEAAELVRVLMADVLTADRPTQ